MYHTAVDLKLLNVITILRIEIYNRTTDAPSTFLICVNWNITANLHIWFFGGYLYQFIHEYMNIYIQTGCAD